MLPSFARLAIFIWINTGVEVAGSDEASQFRDAWSEDDLGAEIESQSFLAVRLS